VERRNRTFIQAIMPPHRRLANGPLPPASAAILLKWRDVSPNGVFWNELAKVLRYLSVSTVVD
jgi:hypothetical protein